MKCGGRFRPLCPPDGVQLKTGLLLREGNATFGTFHESVELDAGAQLADELFEYADVDQLGRRYG